MEIATIAAVYLFSVLLALVITRYKILRDYDRWLSEQPDYERFSRVSEWFHTEEALYKVAHFPVLGWCCLPGIFVILFVAYCCEKASR